MMETRTKIVVVLTPFIIAAVIGGGMAWPAYEEWSAKRTVIEEKKQEESALAQKLTSKLKMKQDKKELQESLLRLHNSVPKKPELELLNIDLERMCQESKMDLISFSEANREQLRSAGVDDPAEVQRKAAQALKDKAKAAARTAVAASVTAAAAAAGKKAEVPDSGLSKIIVAVKCIGDYDGLEELVHRLETYQRVVNITELKTTVPKKVASGEKEAKSELPEEGGPNDGEEQGDFHRLNCSFLLTAYYSP